MFKKKDNSIKIFEEGVFIKSYGSKISKDLKVFYNPEMKLNRDISLLVIKTFFDKEIKYCDPMSATGIRQLRFIKTIPEMFSQITIGDISSEAIKNIKKNFKNNSLSLKKIKLSHNHAINTISSEYFDFIELDPFGSPVPFLDIACQRIKHNGILSVTATDTAALCGTYPKTSLRKYGVNMQMTHCYEELGVRNLIAYCIRQGAKYDKILTPILSYSQKHYYKIFFKVTDSRTKVYEEIRDLKYINWDKKTQDITILDYEEMNSIGKTYVKNLQDKEFVSKLKENLNLISENSEISKLLDSLETELDIVGHYNPHKLEKEFKFSGGIKFDKIIEILQENGFEAGRPHNNKMGIKTNATGEKIVEIMKKYEK